MAADVIKNLKEIQQKIRDAEKKYNRENNSVKLLAVTKGQSIEKIKSAILAGQTRFGENYLQEALAKIKILPSFVEWHFIGHIQSNKTKIIAENFAWVHGVAHAKIAKRLSAQRPIILPPLNVCIEVNLNNEENKSGVSPNEVFSLARELINLPRLCLRGLMSIPQFVLEPDLQYKNFMKLTELKEQLAREFKIDTLSMGMSNDFEMAIAAGSTCVRIGTAIFGERIKKDERMKG